MLVKDYLYGHNYRMEPVKRPRGRPPIEEPETDRVELRVSPERKARYRAAAERAGKGLATWAKAVLDRASKR